MEEGSERLNDFKEFYSSGVGRITGNETTNNFIVSKEIIEQREKSWNWFFEKYAQENSDDEELCLETLQPTRDESRNSGDEEPHRSEHRERMRKRPCHVQFWVNTGLPPCKATDEISCRSDTSYSLSEEELVESVGSAALRNEFVDGKQSNGAHSSYDTSVDTAAYILSNTNMTKRAAAAAIIKDSKTSPLRQEKNIQGDSLEITSPRKDSVGKQQGSKAHLENVSLGTDNGSSLSVNASTRNVESVESNVANSNSPFKSTSCSKASTSFAKSMDSNPTNELDLIYSIIIAAQSKSKDHIESPVSPVQKTSPTKPPTLVSNVNNLPSESCLSKADNSSAKIERRRRGSGSSDNLITRSSKKPFRFRKLYTGRNSPTDVITPICKRSHSLSLIREDMHPALKSPVMRKPRFSVNRAKWRLRRRARKGISLSQPIPELETDLSQMNAKPSSEANDSRIPMHDFLQLFELSPVKSADRLESAGPLAEPILELNARITTGSVPKENAASINCKDRTWSNKSTSPRSSEKTTGVVSPTKKQESSGYVESSSLSVSNVSEIIEEGVSMFNGKMIKEAPTSLNPFVVLQRLPDKPSKSQQDKIPSPNVLNENGSIFQPLHDSVLQTQDSRISKYDFLNHLELSPVKTVDRLQSAGPPAEPILELNKRITNSVPKEDDASINCKAKRCSNKSTSPRSTEKTTGVVSPTKKQVSPGYVESSSLSVSNVSEIIEEGVLTFNEKMIKEASLNPFVMLHRLPDKPSKSHEDEIPSPNVLNEGFDENGSIFQPLDDSVLETQEVRAQNITHAKKNLYSTELEKATSSSSSYETTSETVDSDQSTVLVDPNTVHRWKTKQNIKRKCRLKPLQAEGKSEDADHLRALDSLEFSVESNSSKGNIRLFLEETLTIERSEAKSPEIENKSERSILKSNCNKLNLYVALDKLPLVNGTRSPEKQVTKLETYGKTDSKKLEPIVELERSPLVDSLLSASRMEKCEAQLSRRKRKRDENEPDLLEKLHTSKKARERVSLLFQTNLFGGSSDEDDSSEQIIIQNARKSVEDDDVKTFSYKQSSTGSRDGKVSNFFSTLKQNSRENSQSIMTSCALENTKSLFNFNNEPRETSIQRSAFIVPSSDEEDGLVELIKNMKAKKTRKSMKKSLSGRKAQKQEDQLYKGLTENVGENTNNMFISNDSDDEKVVENPTKLPYKNKNIGSSVKSNLRSPGKVRNKHPAKVLEKPASNNVRPKRRSFKRSTLPTRSSAEDEDADDLTKLIKPKNTGNKPEEPESVVIKDLQLNQLHRDLTEDDEDIFLRMQNQKKLSKNRSRNVSKELVTCITNDEEDTRTAKALDAKHEISRKGESPNRRVFSNRDNKTEQSNKVKVKRLENSLEDGLNGSPKTKRIPNARKTLRFLSEDENSDEKTPAKLKKPPLSTKKSEVSPPASETKPNESVVFTSSDEERFNKLQASLDPSLRKTKAKSRASDTKALSNARKTLFASSDMNESDNLEVNKPFSDNNDGKTMFFPSPDEESEDEFIFNTLIKKSTTATESSVAADTTKSLKDVIKNRSSSKNVRVFSSKSKVINTDTTTTGKHDNSESSSADSLSKRTKSNAGRVSKSPKESRKNTFVFQTKMYESDSDD